MGVGFVEVNLMSMNLIFAIDAQVYMKCKKKIDLCTCEAISYVHDTMKTAFWVWLSISIRLIHCHTAKTTV